MSGVAAIRPVFRLVVDNDPELFKASEAERISELEHLRRALKTDDPLAYINEYSNKIAHNGVRCLCATYSDVLKKMLATQQTPKGLPFLGDDAEVNQLLSEYKMPEAQKKAVLAEGNFHYAVLGHGG